ncbi:MAG: RNA polymerase sigma factor [Planctomycetota bacterium]
MQAPDSDPPSTVLHVRRAAQSADDQSWSALSDRVFSFVDRRFRMERLPDGHDLDDLKAEVLLRLFHSLPKIEIRGRPEFWSVVHRIADNARIDLWRRERARKQAASESPATAPAEIDSATPSAYLRLADLNQSILDCIAEMRPETAEVLRLRLLEHLSFSEIAERIGRNKEATVRYMYRVGRDQLHQLMLHRGFEV